jgi:hypothetical protein
MPGLIRDWKIRALPDGEWKALRLPQAGKAAHWWMDQERRRGFAVELGGKRFAASRRSSRRGARRLRQHGRRAGVVTLNGTRLWKSEGWTGWHAGRSGSRRGSPPATNTIEIESGGAFFLSVTDENRGRLLSDEDARASSSPSRLAPGRPASNDYPAAAIVRRPDFEVTRRRIEPAWARSAWTAPAPPGGRAPLRGALQAALLDDGIYVLMDGTDTKLTTTGRKDFEHLWEEDVYEAFLWTDGAAPVYFEYEISPMNPELPILVPNNSGTFMGWLPWHYAADRKVGRRRRSGAARSSRARRRRVERRVLHPLRALHRPEERPAGAARAGAPTSTASTTTAAR